MLIGIVIGLACLFGVVAVYANRDELKGPPRGRELAAYAVAVLVSIALGVGIILLTTAQQDICGPPGGSISHCA